MPPEFYAGPRRRLLRRFRMWVCAPYAFEAVAAAAILRFGAPIHLLYLALVMVVIVVVVTIAATVSCSKLARAYEVEGSSRPASSVVLSLTTRRLADYTDRRLEWLLATVNLGALAAVADAYLAWKEESRRFWDRVFDSVRAILAANLALLAAAEIFNLPLAFMAVWIAWYVRQRDRYLELARRTRPARLPDSIGGESVAGGLLCFRPAHPALLVRSARGYALNLGSRRAQVGALYFAGLAAILVGGR